jgi:hypothetical protein
MIVLLSIHRDTAPSQLGNGDMDLVDVRILRDEKCANVQSELLRGEDVRRGLGED